MTDALFNRMTSPRLVLRRLRESDLPAFRRYRSDPRVARYQDWTEFPAEEAARFLAEQARLHPGTEGAWFQMAIELAETGEIIGDCGLHAIAGRPGQVEIGFTMDPEHQGNGYATEAVRRLLDYAFGELGKRRAIAVIDARNEPAARLLERVGMRREGHFLQNVWFKGEWGDECLYALLEPEWAKTRGPSGP